MAENECSGNVQNSNRFGWEDYLVFAIVLVISMGIGVFFGCFKNKQKTATEFLMGGRQMNFWTLGASLTLGFTSAIAILGNPAEMYNFGTQYAMGLVVFVFVVPLTAFMYLPTFRGLGITSIYEYLDRRFCNKTRLLMSFFFIIQTLLYLAVVVYAPALALEQVTGLNVLAASAITFAVSLVYASLGGIRAVVWTDTFQFVVIMGALIAVLILGGIQDGGPAEVWQNAYDSGRIEFFNMNPDPRIRHSFWTTVVGSTFYWLSLNAATQSSVQRLMTARTNRHALWALILSGLGMMLIFCTAFYIGLVTYTHFKDCDPLLNKEISATDQILPLYVMEIASSLPGLPGLFVAGVFSASLSTVASALNALAATTLKDVLAGGFNFTPTEAKAALVSKALSALYGVLCFSLVFLVMQLGGVMQVAISLNGMLAGAALGTFTLGMYVPWCNEKGAIVGSIAGFAVALWLCIGAQVATVTGKLALQRKPVGMQCNCTIIEPNFPDNDLVFDGYRISYLYYAPIAYLVTMVVGVIISGLTGWQKLDKIDPELLSPWITSIFKLPKKGKAHEIED
ncbi:sodium-coupled monocarboxylate transporter 2-like [Cloeon dipterum]|uniref:sodium-coupled monocarboxylate transporter 2-like n=1 Tax=Cloeon dipterum TaxID=197152 RepID=UPI0032209CC6